jgi:hypothetical protein
MVGLGRMGRIALLVLCGGCANGGPLPVAQDVGVAIPEPGVPRMRDVTEAAGLAGIGATFVNWLDVQNDGHPDLLVNGHLLYLNEGPPFYKFALAAPEMWPRGKRGPALCVDVDNDGWTDIVSTQGQLWRNIRGERFRNVAKKWGYEPHRKGNVIGAGDLNGDGWVDLYVGMKEDWNNGNPEYYEPQLWLNDAGHGFREAGKEAGIQRKTYARSVLIFDVDGDGDQDIFVGNYRLQPNLLWLNDGNGEFRDRARKWGVAGRKDPRLYLDTTVNRRYGPLYGHTIGACLLDVDNDGALDIFCSNLVHKYVGPSGNSYDIRGYVCDDSAVWRRVGDRFVDWRAQLGVPPKPIGPRGVSKGDELWAGCVAGDVNNDGWTDVFVPQIYDLDYARCHLFLNADGRRLMDRARAAGLSFIDSYAGAWADVDGNGRLDLATAGRAGKGQASALRLLRNEGGEGMLNHLWIKVSLRPGEEAKTTLGSIVTVMQGDRKWVRPQTCGTSTFGQQNDPVLHFGLGTSDRDVTVEVRWPNGLTTKKTGTPATTLTFIMPKAAAKP